MKSRWRFGGKKTGRARASACYGLRWSDELGKDAQFALQEIRRKVEAEEIVLIADSNSHR